MNRTSMHRSDALARIGWHIHRQAEAPPTQFQVLGERASGTNLVRKLVEKAWRIDHTDALGWKHAVPHMVAIPPAMLVIVVQRNALSWARSLYSRPWHSSVAMQRLSFPEFIRAEWQGVVDRPSQFAALSPELQAKGAILQYDRHPITGMPFETIFAMRNLKAQTWLGLENRGCNLVFVRLEEVQRDAEPFVMALGAAFGLAPTERGYRPVTRRLGNRYRPTVQNRPAPPAEWSAEDRAFALSQLDPALEAAWGYGR